MKAWKTIAAAILTQTVRCNSSEACSVCMGDPAADMTRGMIVGVAALLVVTAAVLGGLGYFFIRVAGRSRTN